MSDITPPSSQAGTPVRGLGHTDKRSTGPHNTSMDENYESELARQGVKSPWSPEQEMEDLIETDAGEDDDEEMEQDHDIDEPALGRGNAGAATDTMESSGAPLKASGSGSKIGKVSR